MEKADFEEILQGLKEGKAFLAGENVPVRVHIPTEIDVAAIRRKLKFTQTEFARVVGVAVATLRNWEQGRRVPDGPARVLLALLAKDPRIVEKTLTSRAVAVRKLAPKAVARAEDLMPELRLKLERVKRKLQLIERDLNDRIQKSAAPKAARTKDRAASRKRQRSAAR